MPRKKKRHHKQPAPREQQRDTHPDFTLQDSADALKPVYKLKKANLIDVTAEISLIHETSIGDMEDGVISSTLTKMEDIVDVIPEKVYPEIIWYLISEHIKPDDVGSFAGINRTTYGITKRMSFWRSLYVRYSEDNYKLPRHLHIDNDCKPYGLRQRVIRGLYYTYDAFVKKLEAQSQQDSNPHLLVKRRCVNMWYCKGNNYWEVFFKFKKINALKELNRIKCAEEVENVDANPEEGIRVLQVQCVSVPPLPAVMGATLVGLWQPLSETLRRRRLRLALTTSRHAAPGVQPELALELDARRVLVLDWWHPAYPHTRHQAASRGKTQKEPFLQEDFFS